MDPRQPVREDVIATSWRRSKLSGVPLGSRLDVPYDAVFDPESRLLRAVRPVVDHLAVSLATTSSSILVADARARILDRRLGDPALESALDRVAAAPGFIYAEEHAGTNGLGTVLEELAPVAVWGREHFADPLKDLSCVGAPIRNPITRRLEGVLDVTCFARSASDLMLPLVMQAVGQIETRLFEGASLSQRTLLEEFVSACRRFPGPVLALNDELVFTNVAAAGALEPQDHTLLREVVADRPAQTGSVTVRLSRGDCTVRFLDMLRPQRQAAVLRLNFPTDALAARRPSALSPSGEVPAAARIHGRSVQRRQLVTRLDQLAAEDGAVAILGEPGAGKLRAATYLHARSGGNGELVVVDAAGATATLEAVTRYRAALAGGATVVVRADAGPSLELMDEIRKVAREQPVLRGARGRCVLVASEPSADGDRDPAFRRMRAAFPHTVRVPALRSRAEDVADLVPALLQEHSPAGAPVRCAPQALQILLRHDWPGNVAELESVLRGAMSASRHGVIETQHLPLGLQKQAQRRSLSVLERADRDVILETLAGTGWNKSETAKALGIARATLYRKMRVLGIPDRATMPS
jgi:transcriptional regulator of acetoin/glycerol metabolism